MAGNIYSIYPNYNYQPDRRQQNIPVEVDRRSGIDRRETNRPALDPKLKKDLDIFTSYFQNAPKEDPAEKNEKGSIKTGLFSTIPFGRRLIGTQDAINNHEIFKAAGKFGLLAINSPEDTRDLKAAALQVAGLAKSEIPHTHQVGFSFFRGTLLEPVLKRLIESENEKISDLGYKIHSYDKTLFSTKFGERILKFLDAKDVSSIIMARKDVIGLPLEAIQLEGKFVPRLIARAMLRVPLIGVAAIALLEIPGIINAFIGSKDSGFSITNGSKHICKSATNIIATITGGALLGALLAGFGPVGSIIGLGIGTYLGLKAGNTINNKIDNLKFI